MTLPTIARYADSLRYDRERGVLLALDWAAYPDTRWAELGDAEAVARAIGSSAAAGWPAPYLAGYGLALAARAWAGRPSDARRGMLIQAGEWLRRARPADRRLSAMVEQGLARADAALLAGADGEAAALNSYPALILAGLALAQPAGSFEIAALARLPGELAPEGARALHWIGAVAWALALVPALGLGPFAAWPPGAPGASAEDSSTARATPQSRKGAGFLKLLRTSRLGEDPLRTGLQLRALGLVWLAALPWMAGLGALEEGGLQRLVPALAWLLFHAREREGKRLQLYITHHAADATRDQLVARLASEIGVPVTMPDDLPNEQFSLLVCGAERIAIDGGVAGEPGLAPALDLARSRGIPRYVLGYDGPDPAAPSGADLAAGQSDLVAPELISAIVTSRGIYRPEMIARHLGDGDAPLDVISLSPS